MYIIQFSPFPSPRTSIISKTTRLQRLPLSLRTPNQQISNIAHVTPDAVFAQRQVKPVLHRPRIITPRRLAVFRRPVSPQAILQVCALASAAANDTAANHGADGGVGAGMRRACWHSCSLDLH